MDPLVSCLVIVGSIEVALLDGSLKRIGITRAHLEEDAGACAH